MSKLQIVRIALNGATVFLGSIMVSDIFPPAYAGIATSLVGATSLALRAIQAELPRGGTDGKD